VYDYGGGAHTIAGFLKVLAMCSHGLASGLKQVLLRPYPFALGVMLAREV